MVLKIKYMNSVVAWCNKGILFRSRLHQIMRTLAYAPLLIAGINEEKQIIQVELFTDFQDDPVSFLVLL